MRERWIRGAALLAWGLCACAGGAASGPRATATGERASAAASAPRDDAVLELAARIPAGALRCVVSTSEPLDRERRALTLLVSQTETLPWTVELPVIAHARTRVQSPRGFQTLVWLKFAAGRHGPERIRVALDAASEAPLHWEPHPGDCRDASECAATYARFVAPGVVELARGEVAPVSGSPDNPCARLRREFPDALEVASWSHDSAFAMDLGLLRTDQALFVEPTHLSKLRRRTYSDDRRQVEAYRDALFGADELPLVAGIPALPIRELAGKSILEWVDVSWEDLRLRVEDHERQRVARHRRRGLTTVSTDTLDELRDQAHWMLAGLEHKAAAERKEAARMLSRWLVRARKAHPHDETLSAAQYRVFLDELGDARSALAIAEAMLQAGAGDPRQWQLNRRRALGHLGSAALRPALQQAHALGADDAARMADEIVAAVKAGGSYERAEWGWLTARELSQDVREQKRVRPGEPVRLPLSVVPQTLAYLASREPALKTVYGVHVLARGGLTPGPLSSELTAWGAISHGGGDLALVTAASSDQRAQLRQLGEVLVRQLAEGPVQVSVSLRPLSGGGEAASLTLVLEGRREGEELLVERMDRRSAALDWSEVSRLLAEPLAHLTARSFPPDELRLRAKSPAEAAELAVWGQGEPGVHCHQVERWVVCRGPMHDPEAALRALLRIGDRALADESLRLWGRVVQ